MEANERLANIIDELKNELGKAERKFSGFPIDPIHAAAVVAEEAGELVQSCLQLSYEGSGFYKVRKEAIQVGAMALRFLMHMDFYKPIQSAQVNRNGKRTS